MDSSATLYSRGFRDPHQRQGADGTTQWRGVPAFEKEWMDRSRWATIDERGSSQKHRGIDGSPGGVFSL